MTVAATPIAEKSTVFRSLTALGPSGVVVLAIVLGTIGRLILAAMLGYGTGEGYYVASARALALSYFDQPPLSLWITWAAERVFGVGSTVGNRLPYIVLFAGTTWLMFRLTTRLFGEWAGAWAAVLLNLSALFTLSIGSWVQPDGPLFFFLVAAAIPVVDLAFGKPVRPMVQWAAAGALFGLAMLSKYHAALILAGLILFVVTTPGYRQWFLSWGVVPAAAIAALIMLPVLVWNAQNGWVSIVFQGERIAGDSLRLDWLLRSIAGQWAYVGLFVWPLLIWGFWKALRAGPAEPRGWFLASLAIIPILLFTAAAIWAPLGWHFHWQAPGYVYLFPLAGKMVADRLAAGSARTWRWLWLQSVLLVVFLGMFGLQAMTGWMHALLPPQYRDLPFDETNLTRELLPWSGFRDALVQRGLIPGDRLFAVVSSWTQVGPPDTAIGDDVPVVCLCDDPRNIAYVRDVATFAGWDALIIVPKSQERRVEQYRPYFTAIDPPFEVGIDLAGQVALTVEVFHARTYNGRYPMPLPIRH